MEYRSIFGTVDCDKAYVVYVDASTTELEDDIASNVATRYARQENHIFQHESIEVYGCTENRIVYYDRQSETETEVDDPWVVSFAQEALEVPKDLAVSYLLGLEFDHFWAYQPGVLGHMSGRRGDLDAYIAGRAEKILIPSLAVRQSMSHTANAGHVTWDISVNSDNRVVVDVAIRRDDMTVILAKITELFARWSIDLNVTGNACTHDVAALHRATKSLGISLPNEVWQKAKRVDELSAIVRLLSA